MQERTISNNALHGSPKNLSGRSDRVGTSSIRFVTKDLIDIILPELGIEPVIVHLVGTE